MKCHQNIIFKKRNDIAFGFKGKPSHGGIPPSYEKAQNHKNTNNFVSS